MVAYIRVKNDISGVTAAEPNWYVGTPKPQYLVCSEIQADGHELDYIIDRFANIPHPKSARVVIWKGEFAQFIFDNL